MTKRLLSFLLAFLILFMCSVAWAHSGRTDSNGGHKDNKNVSGLGSYHYHCGGYPAHLHPGGVCPYTSTPTKKPSSTKAPTATKTPQPPVQSAFSVTNAQGDPVMVQQLGTVYSVVSQGNTTAVVRTSNLIFENNASPTFGAIYAPSTGRASLRQTASDSGKTILQCDAGAIVYIIGQDGEYAQVLYHNEVGYIRSAALTLLSLADGNIAEASLSNNGKTDGADGINIRLSPDGYIIGKYRTGTSIVVLNYGDDWCEIEVEGYHGFVMTKFVTLSP